MADDSMTQDRAAEIVAPFKLFCMRIIVCENSECQCENELAAALTAAREEGERKGRLAAFEEAAKLADEELCKYPFEGSDIGFFIRALAAKEKPARWQDGDADELDKHTLT